MTEIKGMTYSYDDVQSALTDAMKALAHRDEMIVAMNNWFATQDVILMTPFPNPQQIGGIPDDWIVLVANENSHFANFDDAFKYAVSMFTIRGENESHKIVNALKGRFNVIYP